MKYEYKGLLDTEVFTKKGKSPKLTNAIKAGFFKNLFERLTEIVIIKR